MAELSVNGSEPQGDVLAGPHEQEMKELEKQATSLDSGATSASEQQQQQQQRSEQPFGDPSMRQQGGQQQQQGLSVGALRGQGENALEAMRQWSVSAYKCTKQIVSERMGKSSRTIDSEVDSNCAALRDTQRRYQCLLNLAASLTKNFTAVIDTQRVMAEALREMARVEPELANELSYNSQTQVALVTNGQHLLAAMQFFCNSLSTLVNKTFEDTLLTVSNYEHARVEFDAYRTELDAAKSQKDANSSAKLDELFNKYGAASQKYERLKEDVKVKMQLLDENKIRVMQKQLLLFHNAISAYFSGNQAALEATMKQFSIKPKTGSAEKQAFLAESS